MSTAVETAARVAGAQPSGSAAAPQLRPRELFERLRWLDGRPLMATIEPYRWCLFELAFEAVDADGRPQYNLILAGRAKKNWKSADLVLASFYALWVPSAGGNQVYLLAADEGQAADDLALAKKLLDLNPALKQWLKVTKKVIERKDGQGYMEILPAQDVVGAHGKTYRLAAFDEIHAYRTWDILEALQLDPTRPEAQMWITSYASIYHRPGVPLFDLCQRGWAGDDPRMLFSWYAADRTTDPAFEAADPETRANPSQATWQDPQYLEQQKRRLPAHKYRRLHLNLPGLPEGSAFHPEPVMDAIERGIPSRVPEPGLAYAAFVDMSGGSNDDAVLAIGHQDAEARAIVDRLLHQGPPPPFNPRAAVARFVEVLRAYGISAVTGDKYAGETFIADFEDAGIRYWVSERPASRLYEALEPCLTTHRVRLPDVPVLEQQLLGLVWRGGKIDHQSGEHDDWANAAAGVVDVLLSGRAPGDHGITL